MIKGNELMLTASIGISLYPDDALEAEQLVQQADTAMYVAKSSGKKSGCPQGLKPVLSWAAFRHG